MHLVVLSAIFYCVLSAPITPAPQPKSEITNLEELTMLFYKSPPITVLPTTAPPISTLPTTVLPISTLPTTTPPTTTPPTTTPPTTTPPTTNPQAQMSKWDLHGIIKEIIQTIETFVHSIMNVWWSYKLYQKKQKLEDEKKNTDTYDKMA